MIEGLVGLHRGQSVAVLGSGPSLRLYTGQQEIAIAVNGAALKQVPYRYFMCGDIQSPLQEWFHASRGRSDVTRIIASFLAPVDRELYPDDATRREMQRALSLPFFAAVESRSQRPLYDFAPDAAPAGGHLWFRYAVEPLPVAREAFLASMRELRLLHGGTISGVAMQLAFLMGAAEIHLWGCSMDNDGGNNYEQVGKSSGSTNERQRVNLASVIRVIRELGVKVEVHGPSRLDEHVSLGVGRAPLRSLLYRMLRGARHVARRRRRA